MRRPGGKELVLACGAYAFFLGLAVSSTCLRGHRLHDQTIWDPAGLYTFNPGDAIGRRELKAGYFPLWDPTRGLGTPHVVPAGATFDYPVKALASLIGGGAGWEFYVLARFLLAGLFCFIAARVLGLRFAGALLAGLSYMLCGYFREFYGLPDMDVTLIFPLVLMFMPGVGTRPRAAHVAAAVLIGHFIDMSPESMAFAVLYCAALFIWFAAIKSAAGGAPCRHLGRVVMVMAIGSFATITANGDSLWPIMELIPRSWHFHPPTLGLLHIRPNLAVALLTPIFDYWLWTAPNLDMRHLEQLTLVPAYLGVVTVMLAGVALTRPSRLGPLGLFLVSMTLVVAGVIFGIPPFSFLARLPLVRYFQNFRYLQPYLAFTVALLAGMGLDALMREPGRIRQALALGAALAAWIIGHLYIFRHHLIHNQYLLAGGAAAVGCVLAVIVFAVALRFMARLPWGKVLGATLILACGLELALYFNLAAPVFGPDAFGLSEPAAAAFIRERGSAGPFRIYGTDQRIIHPNLAGTFGLEDLRDQTPLYVKDYVTLMSAANGWEGPAVAENFLADGKFFFDLDWRRLRPRVLDLMNVRYVLSSSEPGARPVFSIPSGVREVKAPAIEYLAPADTEIGGVERSGFMMHAPSLVRVAVASEAAGEARLAAGIMGRARECGVTDGVGLVVVAEGLAGRSLAFARAVNAERDRAWVEARFALPAGGGLAFSSLPGPRDDRRCDFGLFSVPEYHDPAAPTLADHRLDLVYHREFRVYENADAMPRVFAAGRVEDARSIPDFLAALDNGDPSGTAWVTRGGAEGPHGKMAAARISGIAEGFGRLAFSASAAGPAFAVIADLYYPGWRARVNGAEARVFKTDGALQGVMLPPGESKVELQYVPWAFRIGMLYRIVSVLCAAALAIYAFRNRARKSAPTS